ncbi:phosphopantetheine-binding protein [Burkholderia sp. BCC0405]|uniref:acyl carrier protein n=1 Tax=Burkholderia sp. BCC0405 TaxID=2676298 RepID=UPI00158BD7A5|nr:phosphopantetheine-binding protein [Burkholderia sp. BCC0405]
MDKLSDQEILSRIERVFLKRRKSTDGELSPDMTLEDLGLDSFDTVEMAFALEEEFGVEIPGEGLRNVSTVRDLVVVFRDAVNASTS